MNLAFPPTDEGLPGAVVFWFFVCAWIVVLSLIVLGQLPRAFRDGRRIVTRLLALVNDPPLNAQLAKAESDSRRLNAALERIAPLQRRAQIAISTIRSTPLVPPAIGEMVLRIRAEIRAFRKELS
jgi:hypothetical protein